MANRNCEIGNGVTIQMETQEGGLQLEVNGEVQIKVKTIFQGFIRGSRHNIVNNDGMAELHSQLRENGFLSQYAHIEKCVRCFYRDSRKKGR